MIYVAVTLVNIKNAQTTIIKYNGSWDEYKRVFKDNKMAVPSEYVGGTIIKSESIFKKKCDVVFESEHNMKTVGVSRYETHHWLIDENMLNNLVKK